MKRATAPSPIPILLLLSLTLAPGAAPPAAAATTEPCPEARRLIETGAHAEAAAAARACLAVSPDDSALRFLVARALAYARRYGEADAVVADMRRRFPRDADWILLGARIRLWQGDLDGAAAALDALPLAARQDPDTARLVADIAWFRQDWPAAERLYTDALALRPGDPDALRRRGQCRESMGRVRAAEEDYAALCAAEGGTCYPYDDLRQRLSFLALYVQTGYLAIADGRDSWNLLGQFDVKAAEWLRFGLSVDSRWHDTDRTLLHDAFLEPSVAFRFGHFAVESAVGFTIDPTFSPTWTARIEPSIGFEIGLQLFLKYWYIEYPDTHAHVISPAAHFEAGGVGLSARYYLSVDESLSVNHTFMARVAYDVTPVLRLYVGGGWGDRADYLSITDLGDAAFGVAQAGAWIDITWQHRITIDYVMRYETAAGSEHEQHNFLLGYRVRF